MPKTRTSSIMTGVFLFLCPIVAVAVLAAAQKAAEPWHVLFYGLSSGLLAWFWAATLIAYTRRIRAESKIEQLDKDIALFKNLPAKDGHGEN